MSDFIRDAFDPETFRRQGHILVDALADHLARMPAGPDEPVLPWVAPGDMLDAWSGDFPEEPREDLVALMHRVIREANKLHHPHHMGHQVGTPMPSAALCDLVASALNNGMAVYEHGPSGTAMELRVIQWMGRVLGFGDNADGTFTSGGSAGNLTALLAARQVAESRGQLGASDRPAMLAASPAHYSIGRAVRIMGWGAEGLQPVVHDDQLRMRAEDLPAALERAQAAGRRVIGVVANACCTPTGAYDPLEAIAAFCKSEGLWLHVDGAHGAAACLSEKYKHLVAGIERADSVVWDAHKMLMMPALSTGVVFREAAHAFAPFEEDATYLFNEESAEERYNLAHRTIECTKRMLALKVYAALMVYGTRVFGDYVMRAYDLGRRFGEMVEAADDFELGARPESNIVCFRYTGKAMEDLDGLQAGIRQRIRESGAFYIVQAQLPTGLYLRTALMNPFIEEKHLVELMETVRDAAGSMG